MHMHDSVCQYQTGCVLVAEETAEGPGFLQLIPLSDPPPPLWRAALLCPVLLSQEDRCFRGGPACGPAGSSRHTCTDALTTIPAEELKPSWNTSTNQILFCPTLSDNQQKTTNTPLLTTSVSFLETGHTESGWSCYFWKYGLSDVD